MPALMPLLLVGSFVVLTATNEQIPKLNYEPSCKAAASTGIEQRDTSACKRDEEAARDKLKQEWSTFTADQRGHCQRLTSLGGSPSYVELLTCLEMARDSAALRGKLGLEPPQEIER